MRTIKVCGTLMVMMGMLTACQSPMPIQSASQTRVRPAAAFQIDATTRVVRRAGSLDDRAQGSTAAAMAIADPAATSVWQTINRRRFTTVTPVNAYCAVYVEYLGNWIDKPYGVIQNSVTVAGTTYSAGTRFDPVATSATDFEFKAPQGTTFTIIYPDSTSTAIGITTSDTSIKVPYTGTVAGVPVISEDYADVYVELIENGFKPINYLNDTVHVNSTNEDFVPGQVFYTDAYSAPWWHYRMPRGANYTVDYGNGNKQTYTVPNVAAFKLPYNSGSFSTAPVVVNEYCDVTFESGVWTDKIYAILQNEKVSVKSTGDNFVAGDQFWPYDGVQDTSFRVKMPQGATYTAVYPGGVTKTFSIGASQTTLTVSHP
ncbi:MAG: hypothetical protein H7338_12590 [Candidatus Sericytochromatia bacterium]|nr:hypothetical protein [Candidatus Sericytochromatia bacterium]